MFDVSRGLERAEEPEAEVEVGGGEEKDDAVGLGSAGTGGVLS